MICSCCNKEIKGKFYRAFDKLYCQDCTQTQYKFGDAITDWVDGYGVNTFNDKEDYIVWLKSRIRCSEHHSNYYTKEYYTKYYMGVRPSRDDEIKFAVENAFGKYRKEYTEELKEELNKVINEC